MQRKKPIKMSIEPSIGPKVLLDDQTSRENKIFVYSRKKMGQNQQIDRFCWQELELVRVKDSEVENFKIAPYSRHYMRAWLYFIGIILNNSNVC